MTTANEPDIVLLERRIEFTSLINIRPAQGNRGMTVEDPSLRARISEIVYRLIGEGEPLP